MNILFFLAASAALSAAVNVIHVSDSANLLYETPSCHQRYDGIKVSPECITDKCLRRVTDGLFTSKDIDRLHEIVEKGMSQRSALGGPTILDINTGYIRDTMGLENLFSRSEEIYTQEDFTHYGSIIRRLKDSVMETFSVSDLYFTAPTFITRLDGNSSWNPEGDHDEYWHPHVDRSNTPHYHYSGLLYMSTYGEDFTGGALHFLNGDDMSVVDQTVEPKAGRVVIFTSGQENPHFVDRVTSGQRYVLAFWFTCDPNRKFEIFLDGKAHINFSNDFKEKLEILKKQQELEQKDGLEETIRKQKLAKKIEKKEKNKRKKIKKAQEEGKIQPDL
jgi:predicted 2-oxoglutarate/Fe(II)-dependent dioxygenase YbiX